MLPARGPPAGAPPSREPAGGLTLPKPSPRGATEGLRLGSSGATGRDVESDEGMRRVFRKSDLLTEEVSQTHKIGRMLSWRSVDSFWLGEARKRSASTTAALAEATIIPQHSLVNSGGDASVSSSDEDSEWEAEEPQGIERVTSLSESRVLRTQNWKWLDEEDLAHHLAVNAYQKTKDNVLAHEGTIEGAVRDLDPPEDSRLPSENQNEEDRATDNAESDAGQNDAENTALFARTCSEKDELESSHDVGIDPDRHVPDVEYEEADVFGIPQISGLSRNSITQYGAQSRFLRAGVLTLRSSLLRNSTLIVDKSGADVAFTRSCMERARAAEEVVALLDRVSSLLPGLSTSVSATSLISPDRSATLSSSGFGDIPEGTAGAMIRSRAVAMEKAKGLRKAHNAYANRSRQWARSRTRQIQTHASRNRSKYYESRKRRKKASTPSSVNITANVASARQGAQAQTEFDTTFSPLAVYETFEAHTGSPSALSLSPPNLSSPSPLPSSLTSSLSPSSLPLVKQHRTDRMVENRRHLLQREWEDNVNVDMQKPGSPGVDRPRLVRKGERALSPSLAASPSSSKFLLSMSESSPSLGRQTATVPNHLVPGLRTAGALEAAHPHGYRGRRCNTLLRAVSRDRQDHLARIALVEFREKVSQLKTQRWKDLETLLQQCEFEKKDATPAPTDAASVRRVVQQLMSSRRVSSVAKLQQERRKRKKDKQQHRQNQATRLHGQMRNDDANHGIRPTRKRLGTLERGTTSPVVSLSTSLPTSGNIAVDAGTDVFKPHDEYIPYVMRKSPEKAAAANARTQSLVQRQVARHDRMVAERTFRTARRTAKEFQSLEKSDFERSVHRTLRDRSWDRDYEDAIASSRSFMGARNAEVRKHREQERLRLKRERKEASIANTAIPQDYQNRELLRREIRRQARLELTQVEVEEVERLWARDNYPNRQPMPVGRVRRNKRNPTARERVSAEIEKVMERRRQERAAGPRYPSYPTDPGEYSHLFDNESTNYDPSDSDRGVSADGYSEASSFDERFDLPL